MRHPRLLLLALALFSSPAVAQSGMTSAYTDLDIEKCLVLEADDFGASWACPGYKGFPIMVQEGDLRFSILYGFNPKENAEGTQTLPPFNNLGGKIEWRLSNAKGYFFPIATIVRYHTADTTTGENKGQVLVVTQIAEGNTCHIAYVDALANPNANDLAREAADKAGKFNCLADEPKVIGKFTAY